ncbi:MAG: M23 family metallopeptidase [Acidobacteria bacterium]|nr:M23 family metallopeptidase [Acidobacteriota bacterium]
MMVRQIGFHAALVLVLTFLPPGRPAFPFQGESIQVRHKARALQPGEVIAFTIRSRERLASVELLAFDKTFPAFATKDTLVWNALVGIDLESRPGSYVARIRAATKSAELAELQYKLVVRPKAFPTRRLTVDEKYVTPPPEVLDRIALETKRVGAILAAVSDGKYWNGRFVSPVPGPVISEFGKRNIINGKPRSPHAGTDFRAQSGTPVRAPNAGRIVLAEDLYFSGNTVIIDHGQGLYSYFAHLSGFAARVGDVVERGDVVGQVGATGRVTGPHLHWSVRLVGTRVDPLSLIAVLGPNKAAY